VGNEKDFGMRPSEGGSAAYYVANSHSTGAARMVSAPAHSRHIYNIARAEARQQHRYAEISHASARDTPPQVAGLTQPPASPTIAYAPAFFIRHQTLIQEAKRDQAELRQAMQVLRASHKPTAQQLQQQARLAKLDQALSHTISGLPAQSVQFNTPLSVTPNAALPNSLMTPLQARIAAQLPMSGQGTNPSTPAHGTPYTQVQVNQDNQDLHDAMDGHLAGWGTDEDKVIAVLQGKSAAQTQALRTAYQQDYHQNLDTRLRQELNADDQTIALVLLQGAETGDIEAEAVRLHQLNQDPARAGVADFLRGMSPQRRTAVAAKYLSDYQEDPAQYASAQNIGSSYMDSHGLAYGTNDTEVDALWHPEQSGADNVLAEAAARRAHASMDFGAFGRWGKGVDQAALTEATRDLTPTQKRLFASSYQKIYEKRFTDDLKSADASPALVGLANTLVDPAADPTDPQTVALQDAVSLRKNVKNSNATRTQLEAMSPAQRNAALQTDPGLKDKLIAGAGDTSEEIQSLLSEPAQPGRAHDGWQTNYDAMRLHRAVDGLNEEDLVREIELSNPTLEQIDALDNAYNNHYYNEEDLRPRMAGELGGRDEQEFKNWFDRRAQIRADSTPEQVQRELLTRSQIMAKYEGGSAVTGFVQKVGHGDMHYETDSQRLQRHLATAESALTGKPDQAPDLVTAGTYNGYAAQDYRSLVETKGQAGEAAATTGAVVGSVAATVATAGAATPFVGAGWAAAGGAAGAGAAYAATNRQAGNMETGRQMAIGAVSALPVAGKATQLAAASGKGSQALWASSRMGAQSGALVGGALTATDQQTWDHGVEGGLHHVALSAIMGAGAGAVLAPVAQVGFSSASRAIRSSAYRNDGGVSEPYTSSHRPSDSSVFDAPQGSSGSMISSKDRGTKDTLNYDAYGNELTGRFGTVGDVPVAFPAPYDNPRKILDSGHPEAEKYYDWLMSNPHPHYPGNPYDPYNPEGAFYRHPDVSFDNPEGYENFLRVQQKKYPGTLKSHWHEDKANWEKLFLQPGRLSVRENARYVSVPGNEHYIDDVRIEKIHDVTIYEYLPEGTRSIFSYPRAAINTTTDASTESPLLLDSTKTIQTPYPANKQYSKTNQRLNLEVKNEQIYLVDENGNRQLAHDIESLIGERLGSGAYADVYAVGSNYALKVYRDPVPVGIDGTHPAHFEYLNLQNLKRNAPLVKVLTVHGVLDYQGKPALLMDRHAFNMRDYPRSVQNDQQINGRTLKDARKIVENTPYELVDGDPQWLVAYDGSMLWADPINWFLKDVHKRRLKEYMVPVLRYIREVLVQRNEQTNLERAGQAQRGKASNYVFSIELAAPSEVASIQPEYFKSPLSAKNAVPTGFEIRDRINEDYILNTWHKKADGELALIYSRPMNKLGFFQTSD
jgi:hypothetical protein